MKKASCQNCIEYVKVIDNKEMLLKAEDGGPTLIVSVSNKSRLKSYPDNLNHYMLPRLIMLQKGLVNNVCFNAVIDGTFLICQATVRISKTTCNYASVLQWLWELKWLVYSFLVQLENLKQKQIEAS